MRKATTDEGFRALEDDVRGDATQNDLPVVALVKRPPPLGDVGGACSTPMGKKPRQDISVLSPETQDADIGIARLRSFERWVDNCALKIEPLLKSSTKKVVFLSVRGALSTQEWVASVSLAQVTHRCILGDSELCYTVALFVQDRVALQPISPKLRESKDSRTPRFSRVCACEFLWGSDRPSSIDLATRRSTWPTYGRRHALGGGWHGHAGVHRFGRWAHQVGQCDHG